MTDNYVLVFSIDFDNFYIESLPDIAIIVKHLNDVYLGTGKECLHTQCVHNQTAFCAAFYIDFNGLVAIVYFIYLIPCFA